MLWLREKRKNPDLKKQKPNPELIKHKKFTLLKKRKNAKLKIQDYIQQQESDKQHRYLTFSYVCNYIQNLFKHNSFYFL